MYLPCQALADLTLALPAAAEPSCLLPWPLAAEFSSRPTRCPLGGTRGAALAAAKPPPLLRQVPGTLGGKFGSRKSVHTNVYIIGLEHG